VLRPPIETTGVTFHVGTGTVFVPLSLLLGPWKPVRSPLQQITRLAFERMTKLVQNIGPVALAFVAIKRVERWVRNIRFLGKPVPGHALAVQNALQFAVNHDFTLTN
jgi:hypothetical protein